MHITRAGAPQAPRKHVKDWTVLMYMNGKNDLEPELIRNLLEAEAVGSTDRVDVVAQLARGPRSKIGLDRKAPRLDGSWTGLRRYHLEGHPSTRPGSRKSLRSKVVEELPQADLGKPEALADFLEWGMKNYPARRYLVVLGDHGRGFMGTGFDKVSGDNLDLGELKQALESARKSTGKTPDVLLFDACEMGALEVAYQLKDQASWMVASEEIVGSEGLPHREILDWLVHHPGAPAEKLARTAVALAAEDQLQRMDDEEADGAQHLAAVDLSQVAALRKAADRLAEALTASRLPEADLKRLVEETAHFNLEHDEAPDSDFRDLGHFAALLLEDEAVRDPAVKRAARGVLRKLEAAVAANQAEGYDVPDARGLSIYLPADPGQDRPPKGARRKGFDPWWGYGSLDFAKEGRWDEFLRARARRGA